MINEYYGAPSTPTEDFLAHYGIRGMKWGVQRAKKKPLYSGRNKRLDRQFIKASKKLEKLNKRTDIELQNKKADKLAKTSKIAAGIGAAGIGGVGAATGLVKRNMNKYYDELGRIPGVKVTKYSDGHLIEAPLKTWGDMDRVQKKYERKQDRIVGGGVASTAIGLAGLGTSLGAGIAARRARKRTTKEGHAKAVAERDSFRNEMRKQFAGTAYANKIANGTPAKKKRRK